MKKWLFVLLVFIAMTEQAQAAAIIGYYIPSTLYSAQLTAHVDEMTDVSLDAYTVTAEGKVTGGVPMVTLQFLQKHKRPAYLCIANYIGDGFNGAVVHHVLQSKEKQKRLIDSLVAIAVMRNYKGVNLDFESLAKGDRNAYTSFVRQLGTKLKAKKLQLIVSVPAKTKEDVTNDWSGAFDYRRLAEAADIIQLMTYDEHYSGGTPGPIASVQWVEATVKFALTQMSASKVNVGIAAYGYDWNLTTNKTTTVWWRNVAALMKREGAQPKYDKQRAAAYFYYKDARHHEHEVWYESSASIQAKVALVKKYKLQGLSVWAVGYEDASFWQAVRQSLK